MSFLPKFSDAKDRINTFLYKKDPVIDGFCFNYELENTLIILLPISYAR